MVASTADARITGLFSGAANLAGWLVGLVLLAYFQSRFVPFGFPAADAVTNYGALRPGFAGPDLLKTGLLYTVFVFSEFLILALLIAAGLRNRDRRDAAALVALAMAVLLVLPNPSIEPAWLGRRATWRVPGRLTYRV